MAKPIVIVPTRVALSTGINVGQTPTTEVTYTGHTFTNAQLTANASLTASASFSAAPSAPIAISTAKVRKAIQIWAAADGAGGHFGSDNATNSSNGHYVFPGTELVMTGYNGAVWAAAPDGAQPQKFYLLET